MSGIPTETVQTANVELPCLPSSQISNAEVPEAQIVNPGVPDKLSVQTTNAGMSKVGSTKPTNALPQIQPVPNQLENPSVNRQSPQASGNPESDKQSTNTASTLTSTSHVLDCIDSIKTPESTTVLTEIAPNPATPPEHNLNRCDADVRE